VNFEFERFTEDDTIQSEQATEMVKYFLNSKNNSYQIIRDWAQDSLLHKNGIVMVSPIREQIVQYKEVKGTLDQLRVFETMTADKGLTPKLQSKEKVDVNVGQALQQSMQGGNAAQQIGQSFKDNTVYSAKYKLTGYSTNIKI
jgi:hypothetical protein